MRKRYLNSKVSLPLLIMTMILSIVVPIVSANASLPPETVGTVPVQVQFIDKYPVQPLLGTRGVDYSIGWGIQPGSTKLRDGRHLQIYAYIENLTDQVKRGTFKFITKDNTGSLSFYVSPHSVSSVEFSYWTIAYVPPGTPITVTLTAVDSATNVAVSAYRIVTDEREYYNLSQIGTWSHINVCQMQVKFPNDPHYTLSTRYGISYTGYLATNVWSGWYDFSAISNTVPLTVEIYAYYTGYAPAREIVYLDDCHPDTPPPTPGPTITPLPTQTPLPTNTPLPTFTPIPTNTPLPTYTPYPTNTPYPTYTPMPSATPSIEVLPIAETGCMYDKGKQFSVDYTFIVDGFPVGFDNVVYDFVEPETYFEIVFAGWVYKYKVVSRPSIVCYSYSYIPISNNDATDTPEPSPTPTATATQIPTPSPTPGPCELVRMRVEYRGMTTERSFSAVIAPVNTTVMLGYYEPITYTIVGTPEGAVSSSMHWIASTLVPKNTGPGPRWVFAYPQISWLYGWREYEFRAWYYQNGTICLFANNQRWDPPTVANFYWDVFILENRISE